MSDSSHPPTEEASALAASPRKESTAMLESLFSYTPLSMPQEIEIIGAGFEPVNGKYVLSADRSGRGVIVRYVKHSNASGRDAQGTAVSSNDAIYCLTKWSGEGPYRSKYDWTIATRSGSKCYYGTRTYIKKCPGWLPPHDGWREVADAASIPAPVLVYPGSPCPARWWVEKASHGSWKIVVTALDGAPWSREFSVGRYELEHGPNSCKHFALQFSGFLEENTHVRKVTLPRPAALRMDAFVSYIYDGKLEIHSRMPWLSTILSR
jgi:hypothetical protein